MSSITTRATKGSALTWTEADNNITNLNTDKIENVVEDLTPQLGGDLDVNGKAITSASNGNVRIEPNGSGNIALTPTTGKIILGALDFPTGMGSNGQVLTTNGSSAMSWTTVSGGSSALDDLTDVVITAAATNDVLVYNGTSWVDTAANTLTVSAASTATTATGATNINISTTNGNSSDTTMYPVLVGALSTGNQLPHVDSTLSYNASTDTLTASNFAGSAVLTSLGVTGVVNLNPASATVSLQPTGTGTVTINPATTGTINKMSIGATTASTGAFTTLSASSTVSGTGFSTYLASPPAIGGTTASTGRFTTVTSTATTGTAPFTVASQTLVSNLNVALLDGQNWNSPGLIGNVTPQSGKFTTLQATSGINSTAIGNTTASTGAFTTLSASSGDFTTLSASGVATLGGTALPSATGTTGQVLALSSAGTAAWTTASSGGESMALLNVTGNTLISGTTYRKTLTSVSDPSNLVGTITSNAFNLSPGQYYMEIPTFTSTTAAGYSVRLYGNTSGTDLSWADSGVVTSRTLIPGDIKYFTVGTTENLELRSYTGTATSVNSAVRLARISTSLPAPTSTQDAASVTASGSGGPFSNGGWTTASTANDNGSRSLNNPSFTFGSKSLGGGKAGTLDFWLYYTTGGAAANNATIFLANGQITYNQARSFMLWRQNYNNQFGWSNASSAELLNIGNLTAGTWYHFSLQTTGNNTWYSWVDGVYKGSFTNSASFTAIHFGSAGHQNNSWPWNARYSNIRWSSSQRYTSGSNFTKPTQAYSWDSDTVMLFKGADNNPTTS